jgi:hypothetical protein
VRWFDVHGDDIDAREAAHARYAASKAAERKTILSLRNAGRNSNAVMHQIEHELDMKTTLHRGE